jgi:hypothetical protein
MKKKKNSSTIMGYTKGRNTKPVSSYKTTCGGEWWCTPVTQLLRRQTEKDQDSKPAQKKS